MNYLKKMTLFSLGLLLANTFGVVAMQGSWGPVVEVYEKGERRFAAAKLLKRLKENPSLLIIGQMMRKGADINAVDENGDSALTIIAQQSGNLEILTGILEYLIKRGADVHHQNNEGMTALMYASKDPGKIGMIKALRAKYARVDTEDNLGKTALDHAWSKRVKELLRKAGAKPGSRKKK